MVTPAREGNATKVLDISDVIDALPCLILQIDGLLPFYTDRLSVFVTTRSCCLANTGII